VIGKNNNPIHGAGYLLAGFSLMWRKPVRAFVWVPLFINIVLFAAGFMWLKHKFSLWLGHFESWLPHWLLWLNWLIWPMFIVLVLIIASYLFTMVANLLAAPFNAIFSEKVEEMLTGKKIDPSTFAQTLKEAPRAIGRQLRIILYYIPRALACLIVFIFPLTHIFASPCWLALNSWMMALQYNDYPQDNHKVSFHQMRDNMHNNLGLNLGFGLAALFLSLTPGINLFIMPAAIAGATKMYVEQSES
jgi:CysZ protein